MPYADITIRDRNPLKRWLQRRRFSDALKALGEIRAGEQIRVLDFGAGDGELVRRIAASAASIEFTVFEPSPSLMAEARENLARLDSVIFADDLESVAPESCDYVVCLEVFEHLPGAETRKAIAEIHRLLKPDGLAVIGVPHELFLPAMFKGIFRMTRRYGDFDARPGNILAAVRGSPPAQRPIGEISPGVRYHFHHLGFDHRSLEQLLRKRFRMEARWFSPFRSLGKVFNSEVYFLLRKDPSDRSE
jgi:SAM-dependent methyltransferase